MEHQNHASLFLGTTLQVNEVAAFGVGFLGTVHVWRGLKGCLGVGYERRDTINHALLRIGSAYDF